MAVEVTPLNILSKPGQLVTSISDTFNRGTLNPAGAPLYTPVIQTIIPIANPFTYGLPFCNGASQLILSGQANGNAGAIPTILPAIPGLTFSAVAGQTQFSQATFQGLLNAVAIGAGLMVMGSFNGFQGASWYGWNWSQSTFPFLEWAKVVGGVLSTATLFTSGVAQVIGDVIRLSYNVATSQITVTKNGTQVFQAVDNNIPLAGGMPGYQMRVANSSAGNCNQVILSNGSQGLGL